MHLKRRKIDLFNLIKRRELWRQQINSFPSTHTLSINCPKNEESHGLPPSITTRIAKIRMCHNSQLILVKK